MGTLFAIGYRADDTLLSEKHTTKDIRRNAHCRAAKDETRRIAANVVKLPEMLRR